MGERAVEGDVRRIVEGLRDAWNAADGTAYAEFFTDDADHVTIRGEDIRGREAIARGHQAIFDTIYKGSTLNPVLLRIRELGDGVVVAHTRNALTVPAGPMAGERSAIGTLVLIRRGADWRIVAQHNTMEVEAR